MKYEAVATVGKCFSCKSWFSRVESIWIDHEDGFWVEVCPDCVKDFYPEAKASVSV
jgi:hypothetical protein